MLLNIVANTSSLVVYIATGTDRGQKKVITNNLKTLSICQNLNLNKRPVSNKRPP